MGLQIMPHEPDQYTIIDGVTHDLDLEAIFEKLVDREYTDPLLDKAFWTVMETYYTPEKIELPDTKPSVHSLIEHGMALDLVGIMQLPYHVVPITAQGVPSHLLDWFAGTHCIASIECPILGNTEYVPGVNPSHAIVLSLMQRVRAISKAHLNPASSHGVIAN